MAETTNMTVAFYIDNSIFYGGNHTAIVYHNIISYDHIVMVDHNDIISKEYFFTTFSNEILKP